VTRPTCFGFPGRVEYPRLVRDPLCSPTGGRLGPAAVPYRPRFRRDLAARDVPAEISDDDLPTLYVLWEDDLDITPRPVDTASKWQARQPIPGLQREGRHAIGSSAARTARRSSRSRTALRRR